MSEGRRPSGQIPRADCRAATDFVVEVYHGDGKTLWGISRLLDLSISGACVESTSEWNEGEDVVLHVLLDKRNLLALPARVLWKRVYSKTHHFGLKFQNYPHEFQSVIEGFVQDYETRLHRMSPKNISKV
ncbi:MAG: PilZ domain-containing protein [Elusimicrobia bacterium]|nr:PilZ domain-containing protein [Elusimicrobiota bacterium]